LAEAVLADKINDEGNEAVHVLTAGDASTLALVGLSSLDLLLPGGGSVSPESLYGFTRLLFIVSKVKRH
jgi:hypothetical protein